MTPRPTAFVLLVAGLLALAAPVGARRCKTFTPDDLKARTDPTIDG